MGWPGQLPEADLTVVQEQDLQTADTNQILDAGVAEYLQELVLASSDVEDFLGEPARYSAARLSGLGQKTASSTRNLKLREIAATIVTRFNNGGKIETRFDD